MSRRKHARKKDRREAQRQKAPEEHGVAHPPIGAVFAPGHADGPKDNQQQRENKMTFITKLKSLETWERVAVIFGVAVLLYQSNEMRRTNDIAIEQAVVSRRPVVLAISGADVSLVPRGNGTAIAWNFGMVNYGTFPAIRNVHRSVVVHGGAIETEADDFFRAFPERLRFDNGPGSVIAPGGATLGQPTSDFASSFSVDTDVTQEELAREIGSDRVAIIGRIEYSGLDGVRYRTDFCKVRLATGATANCPRHNELITLGQDNNSTR